MKEKVVRLGYICFPPLVARYLGPNKFGMMNFAVAFVGCCV